MGGQVSPTRNRVGAFITPPRPRPRRNLNGVGCALWVWPRARRTRTPTQTDRQTARSRASHQPRAPPDSVIPLLLLGSSNCLRDQMSVILVVCWVQRAGARDKARRNVVWWWAPPLRCAQRGSLRTTLTTSDATGCPMGARKVGASGRAQPK